MDDIIFRQRDAARPLTGKTFLLSIAWIILKLAVMQIILHLLTAASGAGLLNIALYLYAAWLLFGLLRRATACYVYTLRESAITLERCLGDTPTKMIEIPLDRVVSMRPVMQGERLRTTYRRVTVIDPACRPAFRVRAAFVLSLISSWLACRCAGRNVGAECGYVLVYSAGERLCACVFRPDETLRDLLAARLGEAYGFDERMTRARIATLYAQALERAFPALYPYVEPLLSAEETAWAQEELARRKAERKRKKAKGGQKSGKPGEGKTEDGKPEDGKPETGKPEENGAERAGEAADTQKRRRRKQG